jgi:hypothetical protein
MYHNLSTEQIKDKIFNSIKDTNVFFRKDKETHPPLIEALNEMLENNFITVSLVGKKKNVFLYEPTENFEVHFPIATIKMDILRYLRFNRYYRTKPKNTYAPFLKAVQQLFEEGMLVENGVSEYYHATNIVPKTVLARTLEVSKIQVGDTIADYVCSTKRMDYVTKQYFEVKEENFNKLGVVIDISYKRQERTFKERLFNSLKYPEKLYHTFELDGNIRDICFEDYPNHSLRQFPKICKQKV